MARPHPWLSLALAGSALAALALGCSRPPAGGDSPAPSRAEAAPADQPGTQPAPAGQAPASPGGSASPSDPTRPAVLDPATQHRGKSLAEWIARLGDKDDVARCAAAAAVARYGPNATAAVPALVALLKNPDDLSFVPALIAIGEIGPAAGEAVRPLAELLRHKRPDVRAGAAGILGRLGPPAGKAVPALIAALGAAESGTEKDRGDFRRPIQQLGKYDIPAVFAAARQGKLNIVDLDFIISSLGPGDARAVGGLAGELTRGGDGWVFYALDGLRRIGPKAAPALPTIRALLNDRSEAVREAAAEAVAAIGAGGGKGGPNAGGPKKDDPPADIRRVLAEAGFGARQDWNWNLSAYVRFGSKAAADQYLRGDKFDKIEADTAARGHRAAVREKRFRVTGLAYRPVVRSDIETRGLVADLELPMRVRGEKPFYEDASAFSGVLAGLHPSELDARQNYFLTKGGTLRPCTPAEARVVEQSDGVLYHPERGTTTLGLVFKGKLDVLKGLARAAKDYSVELDFSDAHYARPLAWGFFRKDAYQKSDWDCQKLWVDYLLDKDSPQPVYFPTAFPDANPENIPEVVQARLEGLRVRDKDGKVVGGYRAR